MANPVLTPERIDQAADEFEPGWARPTAAAPSAPSAPNAPTATRTMTAGGTFAKTFILWAIVVAAAAFAWGKTHIPAFGEIKLPGWTWPALLVGFGLAMVTIFKPKFAPITSPLYAVAEGLFLGVISKVYDAQWSGIVLQAVLATAAVFLVCLFLFSSGIVKVTKKFTFVVIAATAGIFVMYFATMIMSLFGADITFWNSPSPIGIAVSVVICIVAALNLFLDFEMIRQLSFSGAPKQMEWYGAFGLTVTMVWLYLEVLRLLSKLRS
ncbi:MAG: Bax inhibitor-1/YccA family protein [Acidimicrobiia bacterium]